MRGKKESFQNLVLAFSERKLAKLRYSLQHRVVARGNCLIWTGWGLRRKNGKPSYGYIRAVQGGRSRTFPVHRLAYQLFVGDVGHHHILHSCDNPRCINPKHLRAGTHAENMQDMVDRSRHRTALSEETLPVLIKLLELGVPQTILSEAFGVAESTISLLGKRKYFKKYKAAAGKKSKEINDANL